MKIWNFKTPISLLASIIWNISEFFDVSLRGLAPIIFQLMIGSKRNFISNIKSKKQ